jgi:hypothetical protein
MDCFPYMSVMQYGSLLEGFWLGEDGRKRGKEEGEGGGGGRKGRRVLWANDRASRPRRKPFVYCVCVCGFQRKECSCTPAAQGVMHFWE